jgi:hypothetical protein
LPKGRLPFYYREMQLKLRCNSWCRGAALCKTLLSYKKNPVTVVAVCEGFVCYSGRFSCNLTGSRTTIIPELMLGNKLLLIGFCFVGSGWQCVAVVTVHKALIRDCPRVKKREGQKNNGCPPSSGPWCPLDLVIVATRIREIFMVFYARKFLFSK